MHSSIKKYDSFYASVIKETTSGCILRLDNEDCEELTAFTFGNYSKGDRLYVTVTKLFDDDRVPRVVVDSVIDYAADKKYKNGQYDRVA